MAAFRKGGGSSSNGSRRDGSNNRNKDLFGLLVDMSLHTLFAGALYVTTHHVLNFFDANRRDRAAIGNGGSKSAVRKALGKSSRPGSKKGGKPVKLVLNDYEKNIAECIVEPDDLETSFGDIGGLEAQKAEIMDLVILPLKRPDLFRTRSSLVGAPKGVLFYGAPGTGKTMMARAIAKESGATFLNVTMSTLMNKFFGESNKLVAALFSLSRKLAPTIIFIDEIDSFLSQRGGDEYALGNMKAEFMAHWDGLLTEAAEAKTGHVMILGATNRPYDLDQAILRRLPRSFEIGLPDESQRGRILNLLLRYEAVDCRDWLPAEDGRPALTEKRTDGILERTDQGASSSSSSSSSSEEEQQSAAVRSGDGEGTSSGTHQQHQQAQQQQQDAARRSMCGELARRTSGYSGSDLKEMCRAALMEPIRELAASHRKQMAAEESASTSGGGGRGSDRGGQGGAPEGGGVDGGVGNEPRPLRRSDFERGLAGVKATGNSAREFLVKEQRKERGRRRHAPGSPPGRHERRQKSDVERPARSSRGAAAEAGGHRRSDELEAAIGTAAGHSDDSDAEYEDATGEEEANPNSRNPAFLPTFGAMNVFMNMFQVMFAQAIRQQQQQQQQRLRRYPNGFAPTGDLDLDSGVGQGADSEGGAGS